MEKRKVQNMFKTNLSKYLVIGSFAVAIDLGLFLFCHNLLLLGPLTSHTISISVAALFSFLCNSYLNFKKTDFMVYRFFSFIVIIGIGYTLGALIILVSINILNLDATSGKLFSLPFVFLTQYYLNSKISFKG